MSRHPRRRENGGSTSFRFPTTTTRGSPHYRQGVKRRGCARANTSVEVARPVPAHAAKEAALTGIHRGQSVGWTSLTTGSIRIVACVTSKPGESKCVPPSSGENGGLSHLASSRLDNAAAAGHLRRHDQPLPLRVVFVANRVLRGRRPLPAERSRQAKP